MPNKTELMTTKLVEFRDAALKYLEGLKASAAPHVKSAAARWKKLEKRYPQMKSLNTRPARIAAVSIAAIVFAGAVVAPFVIGKGNATAESELERTSRVVDGKFYPSNAQRTALTMQTATLETLPIEFTTEGKITIDEDRATPIFSPYAGRVTSLLAAPGDQVKKGQPLFVLEAADSVQFQNDFISALTALNKAKSQLYLAEAQDKRMSTLFTNNFAPVKDVQQAQAALAIAQNDVRTSETALQAMRNRLYILGKTKAEVDQFEQTGVITPDSTVYAPLSGTVLQRKTGPGQYINAGSSEPVFMIGDISSVWLVAYVRETDAPKVRVGQQIKFTVLAYPNRLFEAKVVYVSKLLDTNTRRLTVRAVLDNSDELLNPEMFASVTIAANAGEPRPTVPNDAVIYEGSEARLWVVLDDGAIVPRAVKLGASNGRQIQIISGIEAGEKIVTRGALFIDRMIASR